MKKLRIVDIDNFLLQNNITTLINKTPTFSSYLDDNHVKLGRVWKKQIEKFFKSNYLDNDFNKYMYQDINDAIDIVNKGYDEYFSYDGNYTQKEIDEMYLNYLKESDYNPNEIDDTEVENEFLEKYQIINKQERIAQLKRLGLLKNSEYEMYEKYDDENLHLHVLKESKLNEIDDNKFYDFDIITKRISKVSENKVIEQHLYQFIECIHNDEKKQQLLNFLKDYNVKLNKESDENER